MGIPVPQGRPRAARAGNHIVVYDPPESRKWKQEIQKQLRCQFSGELLSGPLHLYITFFLPRPKSNRNTEHITRPDVSNLLKAWEDASEGILYTNDSQIIFIAASKAYCNDKHQEPCITGTIGEWDADG